MQIRARLAPILTAAFLSILSIPAYADNYRIDFSLDQGVGENTGTFSYDGTSFANFNVIWDWINFDFTSVANAGGDSCGVSGAAWSFAILTQTLPCAVSPKDYYWRAHYLNRFFPPEEGMFRFGVGDATGDQMNVYLPPIPSHGLSIGNGRWATTDTSVAMAEPPAISELLLAISAVGLMIGMNYRRRGLPATES